MKINCRMSLIGICLFGSATLFAADDAALPPPAAGENTAGQPAFVNDEVPSSVPKAGDVPDVTITPRPETKVEEFRVNGKLRYIKITPAKGKPYYLFDSDGDGEVDAMETGVDKARVNQWLLMEW